MTLFPERQEAIKVLYEAAGQLLDDAASCYGSAGRQLNRQFAENCVELAEKIGRMGPVLVIIDEATHDNTTVIVKGVPFDLGYTFYVEADELQKADGSPDPDFEVPGDKG